MSKELPYYQFEPAEHLAGDIQMCSLEAQGLFANIKCIYWIKGCELTLRKLKGRFSQHELIEELIDENVLKVKKDMVIIHFLKTQHEKLKKRKKALSDAGKQGYLKKVEKARLKPPLSNEKEATLKQPEEKRREESKSVYKAKAFRAPMVEEVIEYFKVNGYVEAGARKAWEYYDVGSWKDSQGRQVKNWKQKMRGVWFREEFKLKTTYNTVGN